MRIQYVGSRAFKTRLAEMTCTEKEEEKLLNVADYLREQYGYAVDTGVECWAAIVVADRSEYEEVLAAWRQAKKVC